MSSAIEKMLKDRKNRCKQGKEVKVFHSAAGFYIGTFDDEGPYCRLSVEYYKDRDKAQTALDNRTFTERETPEIMFCNGSNRKCLI